MTFLHVANDSRDRHTKRSRRLCTATLRFGRFPLPSLGISNCLFTKTTGIDNRDRYSTGGVFAQAQGRFLHAIKGSPTPPCQDFSNSRDRRTKLSRVLFGTADKRAEYLHLSLR